MVNFAGKVCLVTGGASGIGRATCELLAGREARVVVADVDETQGREVACAARGEFVLLDVRDRDAWLRVVREVEAAHGCIDFVHLNAGVTTLPLADDGFEVYDLTSLPTKAYRRVSGVNLDGVVFGIGATAPALERRAGETGETSPIVVTASVSGLVPFVADPIYSMTKHALVGLVRSLAPSLEERRLTLNAVCPAGVATAIFEVGGEAFARQTGEELMAPSEVAHAVLEVAAGSETGQCWICFRGRPAARCEPPALPMRG